MSCFCLSFSTQLIPWGLQPQTGLGAKGWQRQGRCRRFLAEEHDRCRVLSSRRSTPEDVQQLFRAKISQGTRDVPGRTAVRALRRMRSTKSGFPAGWRQPCPATEPSKPRTCPRFPHVLDGSVFFFLMCSQWKLLPPSHPGVTHAANASPTASRAPRPPSSSW